MTDKKSNQLGMAISTASYKLVKDLLFRFVEGAGIVCYRCGKPLDRKSFSIEHKKAWLDTPSPRDLFFDLENIGFSHKGCNSRAARRPHKKYFTAEAKREADLEAQRRCQRKSYTPEARRARYLRSKNQRAEEATPIP